MVKAKYQQIKLHIQQRIDAGIWPEFAKLPSENQLAESFNCSRMTARRALTELAEEGILERSQGLGTFVAELKSQSSMLAIHNIADEIRQRGHGYSVQVLRLETCTAPTEVALALALPETVSVFYSLLLHCEQNIPLQLEARYVNPFIATDYLKQDFSQQTPHEYLSLVAPLTEAHHSVEAVMVDAKMRDYLAIATNEPCLQILRRTWSTQGVVSVAKLTHPGSRFKLGGHLTIKR